jgi:hypothetical protein
VREPTGKMQNRYTAVARSLINNHILKEAPAPFAGRTLVSLRTTLRCKNPPYRKFNLTRAREGPSFRDSANVKFHCCYLKNSVSTATQWLSDARGTTFGTPHNTEPTTMTLESIPLDGTNGVRIEILERSDTTLVIRWVEPGKCHYGEQRWRRRSAHTSGTCAVSRRKIRRGDAVFKPAERPAPLNASAMICAELLECVEA